MAEFFINLVVFILALAFTVVIHELGHFITAKAFNVYVTEFSIGFGPALFTRKGENKETRFSIRAVPLGGYCAMVGESMPDFTEEEYKELSDKDKELVDIYSKVEPERRLDGIKKWKRAIVMLAGVTLNFVLGFVLLIVFFTTTTFATMYDNSVVVSENSIAQQAGWKSEDIIYTSSYKIDNLMEEEKVYDSSDITHNLYTSVVELSNYTPTSDKDVAHYTLVTSENKTIKFDLVPNHNQENNTYSWPTIGITFKENLTTHVKRFNFFEAIPEAASTFGEYSVAIVKGIGMMFTPEGFSQVGGMIQIFQVQSTMMEMGIGYVINLWAMISINLGIFNLLPFPALDGWHFLVIIIEGITKKELPKKFKETMATVGMVLLFGLMILITFKDIFTLF